jgi:hypothetical protein
MAGKIYALAGLDRMDNAVNVRPHDAGQGEDVRGELYSSCYPR